MGSWKRSCCEGPWNAANTISQYAESKLRAMVSIHVIKVPHLASVIGNVSLPFAKAFTKLTRVACEMQLASLNY
jgi:hypothetical protein